MKTIHRISIMFPVIFLMTAQVSFAQTAEELMPVAIQLEEVFRTGGVGALLDACAV